jgi:hypothetical protein
MRAVAAPGRPAYRWAWGVSGLVAAAALAIPGTYLITMAGDRGSWVQPTAVSVAVDTQGGPAVISAVSGATGTTVTSDGGAVQVTQVTGPLTVSTGGGPLAMNEVTGPLRADTSGGVLTAHGVTATTASLSTGGGPAQVAFSTAPHTVTISTGGGPVTLRLPGGPYALTADSDGGPELIGIATDPAARASVKVTSGGGPILVSPASGSGSVQPPAAPGDAG